MKDLFDSISGHTYLLQTISIGLVASGLIFKGLWNHLAIITRYSASASGRKPLKIRPLIALGGISFEISSFEERYDLQVVKIRSIYF
jgi:hypothetical protein